MRSYFGNLVLGPLLVHLTFLILPFYYLLVLLFSIPMFIIYLLSAGSYTSGSVGSTVFKGLAYSLPLFFLLVILGGILIIPGGIMLSPFYLFMVIIEYIILTVLGLDVYTYLTNLFYYFTYFVVYWNHRKLLKICTFKIIIFQLNLINF